MNLNLQQRFLYLFADYRESLEAQQKLGDEVLQLRSRIDEVQQDLLETRRDSIQRERELNDRLMRLRFGDRITQSADTPLPEAKTPAILDDSSNPSIWKRQMNAKFEQDVLAYQQKMNGSSENSTH